jgi:hypothetical protein
MGVPLLETHILLVKRPKSAAIAAVGPPKARDAAAYSSNTTAVLMLRRKDPAPTNDQAPLQLHHFLVSAV